MPTSRITLGLHVDVEPVRNLGATVASEPALAGTVLEDRLVSFTGFTAGASRVTGKFQERIVRSSVDNTLAFYYRITEIVGGELQTFIVDTGTFANPATPQIVAVGYRNDGLGLIGPVSANPFESRIYFHFTPRVTAHALSRFFFFKLIPGRPGAYVQDNLGTIQLNGPDLVWETAIMPNRFRPA